MERTIIRTDRLGGMTRSYYSDQLDAEATALYKQCEKILADTAANVYLMDLPLFVAIDKDLTGYQFYPLYVQDLSTLSWK